MFVKCFVLIPIQYGSSRLTNDIRGECYVSFVCLTPGLRESFLVLWTGTAVVSLLVWTRVASLIQELKLIQQKCPEILTGECIKGDLVHFKPKYLISMGNEFYRICFSFLVFLLCSETVVFQISAFTNND